MNTRISRPFVLLLFGGCILNCATIERGQDNRPSPAPTVKRVEGEPERTPLRVSTPSGLPDVSSITVPGIFSYELSAFTRASAGNLRMYTYRLDHNGNVRLETFRRDRGRGTDTSLDFRILDDQLKKIIYYYQKVDFKSLETDYTIYDPDDCGYDSDRAPHLYNLQVMADRETHTIKFLEFCSRNGKDLEDLIRFVKMTEEFSYLKPHLTSASDGF